MPVSRDGCVRVCAIRHGRKAFVTAGCLAESDKPVDGIDRSESRYLEGSGSRAVVSMSTSASPTGSHRGAQRDLHMRSPVSSRVAVSEGIAPEGVQPGRERARRGSVSSVRTMVHVAMAAHQPATFAGVAQSVEHLFCKQAVRGSSPLPSSNPCAARRIEVFWRVSRVANGSRL